MKRAQFISFISFATIISVALFAFGGCKRKLPKETEVVVIKEKDQPPPSPEVSPDSSPSPSPSPQNPIETSERAETFSASVLRYASNVSINSWQIPVQSLAWYKLRNRDLVATDPQGEALIDIAKCTKVYVFQESGVKAAPCTKRNWASRNETCFVDGFNVLNHECQSKGIITQTGSAQIKLNGTWVAVAYVSERRESLIMVLEGEVEVRPVKDFNKRTLGPPVTLKAGEYLLTKPGETAGVTAGVPERVPQPFVTLPPVIVDLDLERWLPRLIEHARKDLTDPPLPPIPPPSLPPVITFAEQPVGHRRIQEFLVRNPSIMPIQISGFPISGENSDEFEKLSDNCLTLPGNGQCTVTIAFKPKSEGTKQATLMAIHNALGGSTKIDLKGSAKTMFMSVAPTPSSLTFAIQKTGSRSESSRITLTSRGTVPAKITNISIEGEGKDDFDLKAEDCKDKVLDKPCVIEVTFVPRKEGLRPANISIVAQPVEAVDSTPNEPAPSVSYKIELGGTSAIPIVAYSPGHLYFNRWKVVKDDVPAVRQELTTTLTSKGLVSFSIAGAAIDAEKPDFTIVANSCTGKNVNDNCSITVGFTPRATNLRQGTLVINHEETQLSPTRIPLLGVGKPRNWFLRIIDKIFGDDKTPYVPTSESDRPPGPNNSAIVSREVDPEIQEIMKRSGTSAEISLKAKGQAIATNANHKLVMKEAVDKAKAITKAQAIDTPGANTVTSIAFSGVGTKTGAVLTPNVSGVTVSYTVSGTDGYYSSKRLRTDASGAVSFKIPPGRRGVVDTISVTAVLSGKLARTTYVWK